MKEPELILPRTISPRTSGRRKSTDSNSPEFQFCTSFPQTNLLTADELFSGGFLLPLHNLNLSNGVVLSPNPEESGSGQPEPPSTESANLSATAPTLTSSKRWTDIFKKNDNNSNNGNTNDVKEKKRKKKNSSGLSTATAELNINIWPFSRSRSAGTRPRSAAPNNRKVSSAPCSRSNSTGESKSKIKYLPPPSSPNRAGVHLRRASPVWQVRRSSNEGGRKIPSSGTGARKARILSLNVPMCIGYRHQLSCRSDENSAISIAAAVSGGGGGGGGGDCQSGARGTGSEGVRGSNLFGIRNLFSKKVY